MFNAESHDVQRLHNVIERFETRASEARSSPSGAPPAIAPAKMTYPDALSAPLAKALEKKGYTTLTPVQLLVLQPEVEGRDLRITSQTGSGKTIAIGLAARDAAAPSPEPRKGPKMLVVVPTRELARQVDEELSWLYRELGGRVAVVSGGASYRDEHRALAALPTVVVGTPGRLLDHLNRGALDASSIQVVVLDEADRMLDMGFRDDLEAIFAKMPKERRTHLVSATFPFEVERLARRIQAEPFRVEGTKLGVANADIDHLIYLVDPQQPIEAVINILLSHPADSRALVFAATRAEVGDMAAALHEAGLGVSSISGDLEQRERTRALSAFKSGRSPVLVATDVAARGLDVQDIGLVLHVDTPNDADTYTHRSGRTGRAGKTGTSAILVPPRRLGVARRIMERAKVKARIVPLPTAESLRKVADDRLVEQLSNPESDAEPPSERIMRLAKRLAAIEPVELTIARLLDRSNAINGPEPRDVRFIAPPASRSRPTHARAPEPTPVAKRSRPTRVDAPPAPRARPSTRGEAVAPTTRAKPSTRGEAAAPTTRAKASSRGEAAAPTTRAKASSRGEAASAAPRARPSTRSLATKTPSARSRPRRDDAAPVADLSWSNDAPTTRSPVEKRSAPKSRQHDDGDSAYRTFRVTWGALHGADPRRLLAMLCRRGGIESSDVGSIDVGKTQSIVEIADGVADSFAESAGRRDPRDPKVAITADAGAVVRPPETRGKGAPPPPAFRRGPGPSKPTKRARPEPYRQK